MSNLKLPALSQPPEGATPRRRTQWMVISYDITDDKRRTRVMKVLEGHGRRVQFSVFECDLRPEVLEKLRARLLKLIDANQDDLRIYPLCENCLAKTQMLGRAKRYERVGHIIT